MNKALWSKKALAIPACAAIVIGGVTLVATPANADPADLKVTSQSVDGRVLTVTGTGTAGDNIQLDEDFRATRHPIAASGAWTITYTIPGTSTDATQYTITQTRPNGLNEDGQTTITAAADKPFAITGQSVSGRTLTVTGTGDDADTVNFDVGFPVRRTPISADGTWTLSYDIPGTDTDQHTYTINEQRPNLSTVASLTVTAAAEKAQAEFSVTSPDDGATLTSRTVTFTGTGREGDQVNVLDAAGDRLGGFSNFVRVGADEKWTLDVTFADDAAQQQKVTVADVRGGGNGGQAQLTLNLPAATPASQFTLTTPKDGSTVDSRTVTFTGTGTVGDLVNVLDADGNRAAPQVLVQADGSWTTTGTFSDSAALVQDLSVNQVGGGQGQGDIDFTITLPAVEVTPGTGTPSTGTPGTGTGTGTGTTPTTGTPVTSTPTTGGGTSTGTTPTRTPVGTLPVVSG